MTTLTTRRSWILSGLLLVALGASAAAQAEPAGVVTAPPATSAGPHRPVAPRPLPLNFAAPHGFYETQLAPRMSAELRVDDVLVGARVGDPASRLWASDPALVTHVERRTIRSVAEAFKGYAVEQLGIDRMSVSLLGRSSLLAGSGGVRLRLGFSRLAPRADVLIPVSAGRVEFSVDARGDVRTTFDPQSSRFRIAADVDVPGHTATVGLGVKF